MYLTIDSSRKVTYSTLRPHSSVTKTESTYPPLPPSGVVYKIWNLLFNLIVRCFFFFVGLNVLGILDSYIWISRGSVYPWTWSGLLVSHISDYQAINCTLCQCIMVGFAIYLVCACSYVGSHLVEVLCNLVISPVPGIIKHVPSSGWCGTCCITCLSGAGIVHLLFKYTYFGIVCYI